MPLQLDTMQLLAIAAALGWASGLRLYLVVFLTGFAGAMSWVELPAGLHVLQHPTMLSASGFMLFLEFFADKIPGLDTLWDLVHTLVRIPAGAALAAAVFGADHETWMAIAALMGGTLAATSHVAKATTRAMESVERRIEEKQKAEGGGFFKRRTTRVRTLPDGTPKTSK